MRIYSWLLGNFASVDEVEYVEGRLNIHDNPVGVMTNNPSFDWHLNNLARYANLRPESPDSLNFNGNELPYPGDGSGLFGIPGEATSPSRFVRTALYVKYSDAPETADKGVILAAHILNAVDIPIGISRVPASVPTETMQGSVYRDYTLWAVIKDLKNKVLYYRTYNDLTLRKVDLKALWRRMAARWQAGSAGLSSRIHLKKGLTSIWQR